MKKIIYIFIVVSLFTTCKKKTSISVRVFNPALAEYVPNATIALVERKGVSGGGILSGNASCKQIATTVTDGNGVCYFDKTKLRTGKNYYYFLAVINSWGVAQDYPCGGVTSGFIDAGINTSVKINDGLEASFKVRFTNLNDITQTGDSVVATLTTLEHINSKGSVIQGGGGVFLGHPYYNPNNPPNYPNILYSEKEQTYAQQLKRYFYKRKKGVETLVIDTVKVYPNKDNIIEFVY
jgi:hypothetical protein